ncbi:hypothetical protein DAEQUDRAFT_585231 [Daedalea quercina L-15889]|uniref:Uncharacterized protein n=1 Tax=Daedalea quercina L-15889 TaxID=1314783 RepID=A0A165LQL9_9APHY|nr:hypothetical protein DAEQUDRAFT_585231 [Daedalea quercina L-15889]
MNAHNSMVARLPAKASICKCWTYDANIGSAAIRNSMQHVLQSRFGSGGRAIQPYWTCQDPNRTRSVYKILRAAISWKTLETKRHSRAAHVGRQPRTSCQTSSGSISNHAVPTSILASRRRRSQRRAGRCMDDSGRQSLCPLILTSTNKSTRRSPRSCDQLFNLNSAAHR